MIIPLPVYFVLQRANSVFGFLVLYYGAISSVIGASYTSVSFLKTFHPLLAKYERLSISVFIILTTVIFIAIGKPRQLMLLAGLVNGLILPIALAVLLIACRKPKLMKGYRHPLWMQLSGWIVVAVMGWMGYLTIAGWLAG